MKFLKISNSSEYVGLDSEIIKLRRENIIKNNIKYMIKKKPMMSLKKIKKINDLENKINKLELYIIHLETSPFGKEYEKCKENFNNSINKIN